MLETTLIYAHGGIMKTLLRILGLVLLLSLTACGSDTQTHPTGDPDNQTSPNQDEPNQDAPNQDAPNQDAPNQDDPNQDDPNQDEPNQDDPNQDDPNQDDPNQDDPNQDDPNQDEPDNLSVDELRPDRGPLEGDTPFVIEGEGFTDDTIILFGNQQVEPDVLDGLLSGQTPPGNNLGPVTVRVIDDLTGEVTLSEGFTYIEGLHFDDAQPTQLPRQGGALVTVYGAGFTEDTEVVVGNRSAPQTTLITSNQLQFIAPPHPPGDADLRLTNEDQSIVVDNALHYLAALEAHAVDPSYGDVAGEDIVTIEGAAFSDDLSVYFGDQEASVLDVTDDGTEADVMTPSGQSGVVDLHLETDTDTATLEDAFLYVDDPPSTPSLENISPRRGSTSGGDTVYLVGQFQDLDSSTTITFGDQQATILSVEDFVITLETPAATTAGSVDVSIDDPDYADLEDGFTYVTPLELDDVSPTSGSTDGGTSVTLQGQGFDDLQSLRLGGQSLTFDVIDDQTLTFSTPSSSAGPADLFAQGADGQTDLLEEAFFYEGALDLWHMTPLQGSIAGGTYVELSGTGFHPDMSVTFGDLEAQELTILDPNTVALRTPAQGSGTVEVTAEYDDQSQSAPELFTYFNPGAESGGAWGNPVSGAINITVFSTAGMPVEDAFVMLSTNPSTTYVDRTDAMGLATLSGPDVMGPQTITVTASGHSSATVQQVDAENITVFLHPLDGDGDPPEPVPTSTANYHGQITGLDKIDNPGPDEILMAKIATTSTGLDTPMPDPGPMGTVYEDGDYSITTRIGDLALVAFGGLYNTETGEFRPTWMGVERYLVASSGGSYEVDIDLDIPLDDSFAFKFSGAPFDPDGPNTKHAEVYLDLGIDGLFGPLDRTYSDDSTNSILLIDKIASLEGDLHDAAYHVLGEVDSDGNNPRSRAFVTGIDETDTTHSTPPMAPVVEVTSPEAGTNASASPVYWNRIGPNTADLFYVQLQSMMGEVMWDVFLPGDANGFIFPDFPDLSEYATENADGDMVPPLPYPGGTYIMLVIGLVDDGLSLQDYSYDNLDTMSPDSVSISQHVVSF